MHEINSGSAHSGFDGRLVVAGEERAAWAVRRDRVEASDGLMVVVDLATSSASQRGK